ncbi:MAG: bacillithiol biosynthesis deacetylase BshB1 [Pyrinomonadaceae bacterium]
MTIDVLAIFAHPDDVELTVGGTLLKLKSLGYRTGALDVTRGEMGTRGTPEIRAEEAANAAKILQLDLRRNLELADGHVWNDEKSRTKLVRVLRELKPRVLFTHQLEDPHPDHNHIARLVRESARLASMKNYDQETGADNIKAPIVAHAVFSQRDAPSFVVDVTGFAEAKMEAIRAHVSQFYNPNSNEPETRLTAKGFLDEIEIRTSYFGSLIGASAGEPFYVREVLNVADPFALLTQTMNLYS